MNKKPNGMSQLDYLWTYFSPYVISNSVSDVPSDEVILTEKAIIDKVNNNHSLELFTQKDLDYYKLFLKNHQGELLSELTLEKGAKLIKCEKRRGSHEDVDKGIVQNLNEPYIYLQDSLGQEFYVLLSDPIEYQGQETKSILTTIVDNKIASQIKLDNPIVEKSVELKETENGITANLVIDSETNSSIQIIKSNKGISCQYKWEDEIYNIKFKTLKIEEYNLLPSIDQGTLYFIHNVPCIYFRNIRYGIPQLNYITKEEVDEKIQAVKEDMDISIKDAIQNYNNNLWWEETL